MNIHFELVSQNLISNAGIDILTSKNVTNSVKDLQLGGIRNQPCDTCKEIKLNGCNGHFGKFNFNDSVFLNPAFVTELTQLLRYICPVCNNVRNPTLNIIAKEYEVAKSEKEKVELKKRFSQELEISHQTKCLNVNCKVFNKKTNNYLKIDKFTNKNLDYSKTVEKVYLILKNLYIGFCKLYFENDKFYNNITDMLFYGFYFIPSNYIREPDYFTTKTQNTISNNHHTSSLNNIVNSILTGKKEQDVQLALIKIDTNKFMNPYKKNVKTIVLSEQLGGISKDSLIRDSILARRLDESGRIVLGPATDLQIGNIYVPEFIMKNLSYKIYYNRCTEDFIFKLINNQTPYVVKRIVLKKKYDSVKPSTVLFVNNGNKIELTHKLSYGDYLDIEKPDNTPLMFGRQPSLHKWNIQSSKAISIKTNTIKIPICIESSQNGDNDGDTNFVFSPKNEGSNIEQILIMNSKIISKSACNQSFIYGLVQDQIISIYLLSVQESIKFEDCLMILGNFSYLLTDVRNYTGKELLSLPLEKVSFKDYFLNGQIILPKITSKYLTILSYDSIFNIYSQITDSYKATELLNYFKEVAHNFIKFKGFSVKASEVLNLNNDFKDKNNIIVALVNEANNKLEQLISDVKDNKIKIFSFDEIIKIKQKNIQTIQNTILSLIQKDTLKKGNLSYMTEAGYKRGNNEIIKSEYFLGQQGEISRPGINGRSLHYYLPKNLGLEESGFIKNGLLFGIDFAGYINHIRNTSHKNLINVTSGTAKPGTIGRFMIKFMDGLVVNQEGGVNKIDQIIIPNTNFLKIAGEDLVRVEIKYPDFSFNTLWDLEQQKCFNKLKKYLVYDNRSKKIKSILFYLNIESFINSFKTTENIIDEKIGLELLEEKLTLLEKYYFGIIDLTSIRYIFLSYLNPRLISLTKALIEEVFKKIFYLLRYSLSPGYSIGADNAHHIQEKFTQQTLSSFHSQTKTGTKISVNATDKFESLAFLTLANKFQIITVKSKELTKIENIKKVYEYFVLDQVYSEFNVLNSKDKYYEVELITAYSTLEIKNMELEEYLHLFHLTLLNMQEISSYWIRLFIIDNSVIIKIGVQLNDEGDKLELNKLSFKYNLLNGVKKGFFKNQTLEIIKTITYNDKLEEENIYELSFFINNIVEMSFIDTRDLIVDLGAWCYYETCGIFPFKMELINRFVEIGGEDMYLPFYTLASYMCSGNKPMNIKSGKKKGQVFKNIGTGARNVFTNAALTNKVDKCEDTYVNMFLSKKMKSGTNYQNIYLDLNTFKDFKYNKVKEIKDINSISVDKLKSLI